MQNFWHCYTQIARWTRPIKDVLSDPSFQKISQYSPYPDEFKALIENKTESFYGRKFVFDNIQQFISSNSNGYFIVVGDAGMGKSTIAAKYVLDNQYPCYFNERSTGRNTPELFLKSLRQQLINRYWLQNVDDADLPTLLQKISDNLSNGERLVIVVDALDEVEQKERDKNILSLPKTLPSHVYFLLTRRPYNSDNKRLLVDSPVQELNLRNDYYSEKSLEDVKEYIWSFYNSEKYGNALTHWVKERLISAKDFVEQVAKKSENNFMYLRYVLPAIAKGEYKVEQLPDGLQEYYRTHWVRMDMDTEAKDLKVIILFILVEVGKALSCKTIAGIAQQDEYEVQTVLDEWVEYLRKLEIKGIDCYTIYHASFLDFLKKKRELQPTRKPVREVNQRIVDFFNKMQQRKQQKQAEVSS